MARQVGRATEKYGQGKVMAASLTRTAAHEIGSRAGTGLTKEMVGTLHAHAFRALEFPDLAETKPGMTAWNEWCAERNPQLRVGDRYVLDPENMPAEGPVSATDGEKLLSELATVRARMTDRQFWRSGLLAFDAEWAAFKDARGFLDFTDLIEKALAECDAPLNNPKAFFLDEAQDMSRLEMALARKWGATAEQFVIVGDPYQNLYEWRGSEPEAFYLGEAESERVLSQSYRVPRAVHAYSVAWAQDLVPEGHSFPEYHPRDEEGEVLGSDVRWRDPERLAAMIEEDLAVYPPADANGEVKRHPTVMVLASCGYMLDPLIAVLRARGIPIGNPYRPTHGGWNPMRGADRLTAFMRPDPEVWGEDARSWTWRELYSWVEVMEAKGVLKRGSKGRVEKEAKADKVGRSDYETSVTMADVQDIFELHHHPSVMALDPEWFFDNVLDSRRRPLTYPMAILRERGKGALRARPQVCVGTIHSVKGGEADVVYVFPDLSQQGFWNDWRSADGKGRVRRQFYVAFTRARQRLVICAQSGNDYVPLPQPERSL